MNCPRVCGARIQVRHVENTKPAERKQFSKSPNPTHKERRKRDRAAAAATAVADRRRRRRKKEGTEDEAEEGEDDHDDGHDDGGSDGDSYGWKENSWREGKEEKFGIEKRREKTWAANKNNQICIGAETKLSRYLCCGRGMCRAPSKRRKGEERVHNSSFFLDFSDVDIKSVVGCYRVRCESLQEWWRGIIRRGGKSLMLELADSNRRQREAAMRKRTILRGEWVDMGREEAWETKEKKARSASSSPSSSPFSSFFEHTHTLASEYLETLDNKSQCHWHFPSRRSGARMRWLSTRQNIETGDGKRWWWRRRRVGRRGRKKLTTSQAEEMGLRKRGKGGAAATSERWVFYLNDHRNLQEWMTFKWGETVGQSDSNREWVTY